jgi:hypothetical protein
MVAASCYSRSVQPAGDGRAEAWTITGSVVTVAIGFLFLSRFAPARFALIETRRPAAAASVIVLACIGFGALGIAAARRVFVSVAHDADDYEALSILDALLVGFAILGTIVAVVAWIGFAMSLLIIALTAAGAALGIVMLLRRGPVAWPFEPRAIAFLAVPVLIALTQAVTPPNSPDELVYKLAVPHAYQLYGRMLELPLNSHSYLTMADHMVSLVALILANGIAARLVHFAIYLAALAALCRLGGWLVAAGVAWTPALMIIAGWAWNDWSTLALLVIAIDRYERWRETSTSSDAAVAFAALGCAASMKYTALPWIFAMGVVIVVRHRRAPRVLAAAAMLMIAFGALFYLRNASWTGSPIAPLLLPNAPLVSNYRTAGSFGGWSDLVRGTDIFDARISDESLGILMPAAALIGIAALVSRDRRIRDLAIIGAIQLPIVITFAPGSRNTVNAVVPIAAAGVMLIVNAARHARMWSRAFAASVACLALFAQGVLTVFVLNSYEILPYLAGSETAVAYLSRVRTFMKPYAFLARTPPSSRILLLGENRPLYLDRQFIAAGNLDGPRIAAWLSQFATPAAFRNALRAQGITHVLLYATWYRVGNEQPGMLEKEYILQVDPKVDAMLRGFMRQERVVYRDSEYLIFEVR